MEINTLPLTRFDPNFHFFDVINLQCFVITGYLIKTLKNVYGVENKPELNGSDSFIDITLIVEGTTLTLNKSCIQEITPRIFMLAINSVSKGTKMETLIHTFPRETKEVNIMEAENRANRLTSLTSIEFKNTLYYNIKDIT